jgi:hypothetical protein
MADSTRRTVENDWASNNPGNVVAPDSTTQQNGYGAVKPPFREHNWLFQLSTNMLQNAEQNGVMEWRSTTAYAEGGLAKGSDNKIYQASQATTNEDPLSSPTKWDNFLSILYPVGTIYTNATVDTNPGTLFGFGTWAAFGAGRVPVGFDSTDSDFDSAEETGGSKEHNHQWHNYQTDSANGIIDTRTGSGDRGTTYNSAGSSTQIGTDYLKQDCYTKNESTLQPYITVYMWKRTA